MKCLYTLLLRHDEVEINKFVEYTKLCETMEVPVSKPFDMMNLIDFFKLASSMAGLGKVFKEYGKEDVEDLSNRFSHPLIRKALTSYIPKSYQAHALLFSYGTIISGNGDIPEGGSLAMSERIAKKYKELCGGYYLNSPVKKILIQEGKATGIELEEEREIFADYVICTTDTNHTFTNLLDKKYMKKDLQKAYTEKKNYQILSEFKVAFSIDRKFPELSGTNILTCNPIQIGKNSAEYFAIRNYDYEPKFSPEGKIILQCSHSQNFESYEFWSELYEKDKTSYNEEKNKSAREMIGELVKQYPSLENRIEIIDVWTPKTYQRYCNSYGGSFMGFILTKNAKAQRTSNRLKGLENVFIGSQWLMGPGGLPVAAAMGKFAAMHVMKQEKRKKKVKK